MLLGKDVSELGLKEIKQVQFQKKKRLQDYRDDNNKSSWMFRPISISVFRDNKRMKGDFDFSL